MLNPHILWAVIACYIYNAISLGHACFGLIRPERNGWNMTHISNLNVLTVTVLILNEAVLAACPLLKNAWTKFILCFKLEGVLMSTS